MKINRISLVFAIALLLVVAIAAFSIASQPKPANAGEGLIGQGVVFTVEDGGTEYESSHNTTGINVGYYGAVDVQVTSDISGTGSTQTVTLQYSNDAGVACSAATNWFNAYDLVPYYAPATAAENEVLLSAPATLASSTNYTKSLTWTSTGSTTITGAMPYVYSTTYTYGSPTVTTYTVKAATAAASGYNRIQQSYSFADATTDGREFTVYGRCMRIVITAGSHFTPTVYVRAINRN